MEVWQWETTLTQPNHYSSATGVHKVSADEADNGSSATADQVPPTAASSLHHEQVKNYIFTKHFDRNNLPQDLCGMHQLWHKGGFDQNCIPPLRPNSLYHNELGCHDWKAQGVSWVWDVEQVILIVSMSLSGLYACIVHILSHSSWNFFILFLGHLIKNKTLPGLCICWVWTAWGCPACPRPDEWDSRLWQEHQGNKIISTLTTFVTSRRTRMTCTFDIPYQYYSKGGETQPDAPGPSLHWWDHEWGKRIQQVLFLNFC